MNHALHANQQKELADLAVEAMRQRGLEPEFSDEVRAQLKELDTSSQRGGRDILDLTGLLWCSIDNDDSRDLDQITVSERMADDSIRILVAIADVDALIKKNSPVDRHAQINTTSVYTSARIFPMLPEKLSTDLTSLNPNQVRLANVIEMVFAADGRLLHSHISRARVCNKAKLAYDSVSDWLNGQGPMPEAVLELEGLDEQLRTQDTMAQLLRTRRHEQGALEFQTFEPRVQFYKGKITGIHQQIQNRARQLIEEFMVAANGVVAEYLTGRRFTSIRRVVRSPERWEKIVALAAGLNWSLPALPDSIELQKFLLAERQRDPERFPDLSLTIVKLMGRGEYVIQKPGDKGIGHFGLAVYDYTHSTAPNRRYPDLITSRLIKAALANEVTPYSNTELEFLANRCTTQEDAAKKLERQMRKSEGAMLLHGHIGEVFDGIVTGQGKGHTWLRIFNPPVDGKLNVPLHKTVKLGDKVRAKLVYTHVQKGYIDFDLMN